MSAVTAGAAALTREQPQIALALWCSSATRVLRFVSLTVPCLWGSLLFFLTKPALARVPLLPPADGRSLY